MFSRFFSNNYDVLTKALIISIDAQQAVFRKANTPFLAIEVIVPDSEIKKRLTRDLAKHYGIFANIHFIHLSNWLWQQIGKVLLLPEYDPFSPEVLIWKCFAHLKRGVLKGISEKLDTYIKNADEVMLFELAKNITQLYKQYQNDRFDWLKCWALNKSAIQHISDKKNNLFFEDHEKWQAVLWRLLLADENNQILNQQTLPNNANVANISSPPFQQFLTLSQTTDFSHIQWPKQIDIFLLPSISPLFISVLEVLARYIDIRVYALNPCQAFWYDIVKPRYTDQLMLENRFDYQEVGNTLLAEWGKETQIYLQTLENFSSETPHHEITHYEESDNKTALSMIQNAILQLNDNPQIEFDEDSGIEEISSTAREDNAAGAPRKGINNIEVHSCHSLTRQLEVLHNRLHALFDENPSLTPADVLVVMPELNKAVPYIHAIFGVSDGKARIPYQIMGLSNAFINPLVPIFLDWLTLPIEDLSLQTLFDWLEVEAFSMRYGLDTNTLNSLKDGLKESGAAKGFENIQHINAFESIEKSKYEIDGNENTFLDNSLSGALMRLYLGYALPVNAAPINDWLGIEGAIGTQVLALGRLSAVIADLKSLTTLFSTAKNARGWESVLNTALNLFDPHFANIAFITDIREAIHDVVEAIEKGVKKNAIALDISAAVIREALKACLETRTFSNAPTGSITFGSLYEFRNLPYRVICLIDLNDGVFPTKKNAIEFDLMAAFPRKTDIQSRDREKNYFLDYLLAARDHFLLMYNGRHLRDNTLLPPSSFIDLLLDYLARIVINKETDKATPAKFLAAREKWLIHHPLHAYSSDYWQSKKSLYSYDDRCAAIANALKKRDEQKTNHLFSKNKEGHLQHSRASFLNSALPFIHIEEITLDQLIRFLKHPLKALFRERLGISFSYTANPAFDEPAYTLFNVNYAARDAFQKRFLSLYLESDISSDNEKTFNLAKKIAFAMPQFPMGATGSLLRNKEVIGLTDLAKRLQPFVDSQRHALDYSLMLTPQWPIHFNLEEIIFFENTTGVVTSQLKPIQLNIRLSSLTTEGLFIYRYQFASIQDYLGAWIMHLALCAAPDDYFQLNVQRKTHWLGNKTGFSFKPLERQISEKYLSELVALYKVGLHIALPFMPKTGWAYVNKGLAEAQRVLSSSFKNNPEYEDVYWRTIYGEDEPKITTTFMTLADIIISPLIKNLNIEENKK